jgi:hypothetical protein
MSQLGPQAKQGHERPENMAWRHAVKFSGAAASCLLAELFCPYQPFIGCALDEMGNNASSEDESRMLNAEATKKFEKAIGVDVPYESRRVLIRAARAAG